MLRQGARGSRLFRHSRRPGEGARFPARPRARKGPWSPCTPREGARFLGRPSAPRGPWLPCSPMFARLAQGAGHSGHAATAMLRWPRIGTAQAAAAVMAAGPGVRPQSQIGTSGLANTVGIEDKGTPHPSLERGDDMAALRESCRAWDASVGRCAAPQPAAPGPAPVKRPPPVLSAPGPQPPAPGPQPPPPNLKNRVAAATPISLDDGMELFIDTSGHVVNGAGVPGELHGGPGE